MLYYIHGYLSSPSSQKGTVFKEKLNAIAIKYRDCEPEDLVISDCLKRIADVIKEDNDVVLIGSSLGGFLAASTAVDNTNVKKLILLNPAIIPPGTDLDQHEGLSRRILEEMLDKRLFEDKIKAEIIIIRATEDDLVPDSWVLEFARAQEATIMFLHDDHRFSKNTSLLPDILLSKGLL